MAEQGATSRFLTTVGMYALLFGGLAMLGWAGYLLVG